MTITTTQKLIKIGTSKGVTLPAKDLKALGVETGEELELVVRKKQVSAGSDSVEDIAKNILQRYDQDFKNLAGR